MQQEMFNLKQVQEKLGVSERTLLRWLKSKELTGFKIGREWRFTQEDIDRFIQRQREKANEDENVA